MSIVYKAFSCGNKFYVYDRNRDSIIAISPEEYEILMGDDKNAKENLIAKYQNKGYLEESYLKRIENPASFYLDVYKDRLVSQLVLQVTQDCNLRCDYCFYVSEKYLGRKFSQKNMDFDLAKRALDYFIEHSASNDEIIVAFYGGEPLLRLDLIKKCIAYMEEKVQDREVKYAMTTNGTLLSLEIAKYLYEKNINLMISLDGTRDNHNKHRVFANGKGSFDIVMKNIGIIKRELPEFFRYIHFNSVISPDSSYKCVREYFEYDDILKDSLFSTSLLQDNYMDDKPIYDDKLFIDLSYGELKALLYFVGRLELNDISLAFRGSVHSIEKMKSSMQEHNMLPEISHHGGPCIAGSKRLFVDISGRFFPCERVSEDSTIMNIGNIDNGVSKEKVDYLINVGKISEEKCLKCWAFNYCKMCPSDADDLTKLNINKKLQKCKSNKRAILHDMKNICMINQTKRLFKGGRE